MEEQDPLENYFLLVHKASILEILLNPDVETHYSININFAELFENDTKLGNKVLKQPEEALEELDEWISYIQDALIEDSNDASDYTAKSHVHARVYGLPPCPELHRTVVPRIEDLDLFLQVTGTVVRMTGSRLLEYQRDYRCTKCKYTQNVQALFDQKYMIEEPKNCANPDKCNGTKFIPIEDLSAENCRDYQEIKIQEQSSKLNVGIMPSWIWVTLEDDLIDICKPGDDVTICGTVKCRWGTLVPDQRIEVELVLRANHIQVNNDQAFSNLLTPEIRNQFVSFWEKYQYSPLVGRDFILKSFCPKIYGMYLVKLAVAIVLAGGSKCKEGNESGIQIRSEPHILLVGDPGTGKSQLLRYAAKIIPRSILTTGVGTTSAGLTAAAILEDGQWQLEGGALVLADGGICCIDEFNSMTPQDRTSIHEAMEQQTISVAKASIVCKLSTKCSILAATNPKGGHLDPEQPLSLNLTLPSPLLSRFDLILMLKDNYDQKWDSLVADCILSAKRPSSANNSSLLWNLETLQQYFTYIKTINPILTARTNKILSAYYQKQRNAMLRDKSRTTVRLLDSLVRLSQAHAKLMFHREVQILDAIFSILLVESSMHGECSVLKLNNLNVQAMFDDNPMQNYMELVTLVLNQLELYDILNVELITLHNKYQCTSPNENVELSHFEEPASQKTTTETDDILVERVLKSQKDFKSPNVAESAFGVNKMEVSGNEDVLTDKSNANDELIDDAALLAQNELNAINLIPSANDEFDLSILNYSDTQAEMDEISSECATNVSKEEPCKVYKLDETLIKSPKCNVNKSLCGSTTDASPAEAQESVDKNESTISLSANNTKIGFFSQSLFESNDIDDLDLDF